ncbi:ATP-binding cassette domain-containing protein [Micromonospora sp. PTRAS2]
MTMIEARDLKRTYASKQGAVDAVQGVSFDVQDGEIVGFLGPNGAGKTTTMRMLTTLLRPTSGRAVVAGHDLLRDPLGVRREIGYVAQGGGSHPADTVMEELVLQARLYRIGRAEAVRRAEQVADFVDLGELKDRFTATLSGGQRRRLDVALGLVHRPRLIFLDEPTVGLDPTSRNNIWSYIRRLRDDLGTTIFLSTHYLDEADALCDRVLIIDKGRIVAEDSPEDLKQRVAGDILVIETADETQVPVALATLAPRDDIRDVTVDGATLRVGLEHGDQSLMAFMRLLDAAEVKVVSVRVERPSLDDVFAAMTGTAAVRVTAAA